jgi:4-amino-4-deoxy-L-arabinose transferase-like glycosyltransferase
MIPKDSTSNKIFSYISLLSIFLLAIAYSTHLTVLEIDPRVDEIRRGLVSLEMLISGNYMVPTINGEPYLNKPPLYNWLLALSYKTFGVNEFALRMPVFVAIFWYGWLIYFFTSKFVSKKAALIATLLFITNGRILIYDSLLGLIDLFYSSIVYLSFMLVYYYGKKEKWYKLFIWSYLLVVIGYLMKGLPSIVYQGFLLAVFFLSEKKWKVLFHRAHFLGAGLALGLLCIYYYFYFQRVSFTPSQLFTRIITESTIRTVKEDANWLKDFTIHFFTYPVVFSYHYAPWTLLLFLVIRKNWLEILRQNNFIRFNALLFFACFFIYWFSPYIIARYMFMLLPLCFTVAAYYYMEVAKPSEKLVIYFNHLLIGLLIILGVGCLSLPFISFTQHLHGIYWKSAVVSIMLLVCGYLAIRYPALRLSFIIMGIICSRFGFNWFVVDQRGQFTIQQRQEAEKVIELAKGRPIFLQKSADHINPDGLSFNIARIQWRVLPLTDKIIPNAVYVTDSATMVKQPHKVIYHWASWFQPNHYLVEYLLEDGNKASDKPIENTKDRLN